MITATPLAFVDTHTHLGDTAFDDDCDQVIKRARAAGLIGLVSVAETEHVWQKNFTIAHAHENIAVVIGIHPHEADQYASHASLQMLKKKIMDAAKDSKIVAIGETGLDYYKGYADPLNQRKLLLLQLEVALACSLPVVIHCRKAYHDLIPLVQKFYSHIQRPKIVGVIHCFSGTLEDARLLSMQGFLIGIDGPITYPSSDNMRTMLKSIPLSSLVLETDCPYLSPQSCRGKRNEPANLTYIAAEVARITHFPIEHIAEITTHNARQLFFLTARTRGSLNT